MKAGQDLGDALTPDDTRAIATYLRGLCGRTEPFDIVVNGRTTGVDRDCNAKTIRAYADASATRWLEDVGPWAFGWNRQRSWPVDAMRARILAGPPPSP